MKKREEEKDRGLGNPDEEGNKKVNMREKNETRMRRCR